jgi:hypothetical protein
MPAQGRDKKVDQNERSEEQLRGEHTRITSEMKQLAERQIWNGVERKYQALVALGATLSFDDLLLGASAARGSGDVRETDERLRKAAKIRQTEEITDWIWDIDQNYGYVEILGVPNKHRDLYEVVAMFAPDKRQAVQFAKTTLTEEGRFIGLLPHGEYSVMGETFEVQPGLSIRLDFAGKKKKRPPKPGKNESASQ